MYEKRSKENYDSSLDTGPKVEPSYKPQISNVLVMIRPYEKLNVTSKLFQAKIMLPYLCLIQFIKVDMAEMCFPRLKFKCGFGNFNLKSTAT